MSAVSDAHTAGRGARTDGRARACAAHTSRAAALRRGLASGFGLWGGRMKHAGCGGLIERVVTAFDPPRWGCGASIAHATGARRQHGGRCGSRRHRHVTSPRRLAAPPPVARGAAAACGAGSGGCAAGASSGGGGARGGRGSGVVRRSSTSTMHESRSDVARACSARCCAWPWMGDRLRHDDRGSRARGSSTVEGSRGEAGERVDPRCSTGPAGRAEARSIARPCRPSGVSRGLLCFLTPFTPARPAGPRTASRARRPTATYTRRSRITGFRTGLQSPVESSPRAAGRSPLAVANARSSSPASPSGD